jgi:hypothetical protein
MGYNASTAAWSVTQLRVLRWLSGGQGERLWIRDPGAVWLNGGRPVEGAAVYERGEEVLVFLRRDAGRYFRTYNLAAGKLIVRRDGEDEPMVEQDLQPVSVLVAPSRQPLVGPAGSAIVAGERQKLAALRHVLAQLQAAIGAAK